MMGGKPARGDRSTRTRDARASAVFRLFAFTFRLQGVEHQCVVGEGFTPRVFTLILVQSFEKERVVGEGFTSRPVFTLFQLISPVVVARVRAVRRVKRRVKEKRG